jgi:hypothetical protein
MGDLGQGRSDQVHLSEAAGMLFGFGKPCFFSFTVAPVTRGTYSPRFEFRQIRGRILATARNLI